MKILRETLAFLAYLYKVAIVVFVSVVVFVMVVVVVVVVAAGLVLDPGFLPLPPVLELLRVLTMWGCVLLDSLVLAVLSLGSSFLAVGGGLLQVVVLTLSHTRNSLFLRPVAGDCPLVSVHSCRVLCSSVLVHVFVLDLVI